MNILVNSKFLRYLNLVDSSTILQSIVWKLISCFCFASINGFVRYFTKFQNIPVYTVHFYQYLFALTMLFIITFFSKKPVINYLKTSYPFLQIIRILFSIIGTCSLYTALKYIPIAQTLILSFLGPVITVAGSIIILKEKLNKIRVISIILCTYGGYLIIKPENQILEGIPSDWKILLPLVSTISFVIAKLITSKIARKGENPVNLVYYTLIFTCPVILSYAICNHIFYDLVFLFSNILWYNAVYAITLGFLTLSAFYSFNKAYALADVTFLMPFGATKLIASIMVGYLAFGEYPHTLSTWIGMLIIGISVTLLGYKKK